MQLVEDVVPYELMKLRLLNASHQAICYLGYLAGYRYAHEVCQDPLFVRMLATFMEQEASPTLQPVPGVDLADYRRQLARTVRQPRDPRPAHPAVCRVQRPHPQVAGAGDPAQPAHRRRGRRLRAHRGLLGPVRRGAGRAGQPDRGRGPAQGRRRRPRRAAAATTRWRSCATPTCSVTSSTTRGSPTHTPARSPTCTSAAPSPPPRRPSLPDEGEKRRRVRDVAKALGPDGSATS